MNIQHNDILRILIAFYGAIIIIKSFIEKSDKLHQTTSSKVKAIVLKLVDIGI